MVVRRKLSIELTNEGKLPITKLEAAVNQLETAITLWFHDGDVVSICTLTFAAHEIIHAINEAKNGNPMVPDGINSYIEKKYQKEFQKIFRLDYNFVKHGAKNAAETHYLAPNIYPLVMVDAVTAYNELGFPPRPLFQAILWWVWFNHPNLCSKKPEDFLGQGAGIVATFTQNRRDFFDAALPLLTRHISGTS